MTSPLVVTLPLIEGEALSGYISRSAKLYETTPRDFCSDLGMQWPALCTGHEDQLNRLAWLSDLPLKTLQNHHIRKLTKGQYQIGCTQGSKGVLRRTSGRLCPKCAVAAMEEKGGTGLFHMLEWSVICVNTCLTHACPLIELPRSENSHRAYDFASRVLEHRHVVVTAAETSTTMQETSFEAYVRQRIRKGAKQDWLEQLDLTHLHRSCMTLGASLSGYGSVPFLNLPRDEGRALCELGFRHLIKGPSGFCAGLEKSYNKERSNRPCAGADMRPFYRWLHDVHTDPALVNLVDTTREHIFKTYPASPEKEVFGQRPPKRQLYTMADARVETGLGTAFIKRLLGYMNADTDAVALKRTDVTSDELKSVISFWQSLANLGEAAALLGILPEQIKKLQDLGALKTVRLTSALRYVERSEIVEILEKVAALPKAGDVSPAVPLRNFCRSNRLPVEKIATICLAEDAPNGFFRGVGCGLHQIMVDPETEFGRDDILLNDDLPAMEAARFLKISVQSIRKLRDAGYLQEIQKRNPDTNHVKRFVTKISIQKFQREFVTLGQAAERQDVRANHLAQKFDRDGIGPIDCQTGFVRVYSINDLPNLNKTNAQEQ